MNKFDLICELCKQQGITQLESAKVVELVFGQMSKALAKGQRIQIRGLWTFKVKDYCGYAGRNPRSGKKVFVLPKKLPVFSPCNDLRQRVDRRH